MAAFLNVYVWEFIQNIPFVMAAVVAMRLWSAGHFGSSVTLSLAGCVTSAAIITLTEPYKLQSTTCHTTPSREGMAASQIQEFVINSLSFAGGTLVVALYFVRLTQLGSLQQHWPTDAVIGALTGGGVALIQSLGPRLTISWSRAWPHFLAFVVMGPVVLGTARILIGLHTLAAALGGSLLLVMLMTFIICCLEYLPFLKTS
jgi:hypothetical protein